MLNDILLFLNIVLKGITRHTLNQNVFNAVYMLMGWSGLALLPKIVVQFGWGCLGLVVAGGLCYSVGLVAFQVERPNPVKGVFCAHEIWHCCVSLGVVLHYLSLLVYVLPYQQS
ncbi:Hemolysin III family protein [Spironucleus salmonicida]|uniref:Hemolysin III family protein n=1 Tax=Spironucleus salmonicida TaxID=348837 RepID=V6LG89_9EUKA|nr:Hemolysin III family protein [Spironucleus salmonicida]|eukprot:EST43308.1 Hemolysin III family protein [Spironucleus salmonicida]